MTSTRMFLTKQSETDLLRVVGGYTRTGCFFDFSDEDKTFEPLCGLEKIQTNFLKLIPDVCCTVTRHSWLEPGQFSV